MYERVCVYGGVEYKCCINGNDRLRCYSEQGILLAQRKNHQCLKSEDCYMKVADELYRFPQFQIEWDWFSNTARN